MRCPCCDIDSMSMSQTEYEVEKFGTVLFNVTTCRKCGYRHTDIMTLTGREPIALTARINSLDDLDIKVIKSATATVSIPEFGATITPGTYSEGYISNVEGVLEKVEDALTFMLSTAKGQRLRKGERMLDQIRTASEGKHRFTLVIKDPLGSSALVASKPGKIGKRRLKKNELLNLKFGQYKLTRTFPKA